MLRSAPLPLLLLALLPDAVRAQAPVPPVLDDAFVTVTRNGAPCANASPRCVDRLIIALGEQDVRSHGTVRSLERGQIAVFEAGESYEIPAGDGYYEVVLKPDRPPLRPERGMRPPASALIYQGPHVLVWEIESSRAGVEHSPINQQLVIGLGDPPPGSTGSAETIVIVLLP